MKILVADDEKELVGLVRDWLVQRGHAVDTANDGNEALELIKKNQYDLAFLDFSLPEKTGVEISDYIHQEKLKIKTVMITGYQFVKDSFVKEMGLDEYIAKPFRLEELEKIITKYTPSK